MFGKSLATCLCALLAWSQTTGCAVSPQAEVTAAQSEALQALPIAEWQQLIASYMPLAVLAQSFLEAYEPMLAQERVGHARRWLGPLLFFLDGGRPVTTGVQACQWLQDAGLASDGLPQHWQTCANHAALDRDYARIAGAAEHALRHDPVRLISALTGKLTDARRKAELLTGTAILALLLALVLLALVWVSSRAQGRTLDLSFLPQLGTAARPQTRPHVEATPTAPDQEWEELLDFVRNLSDLSSMPTPVPTPDVGPISGGPGSAPPGRTGEDCKTIVDRIASAWAAYLTQHTNLLIYCYISEANKAQHPIDPRFYSVMPASTVFSIYNASPTQTIEIERLHHFSPYGFDYHLSSSTDFQALSADDQNGLLSVKLAPGEQGNIIAEWYVTDPAPAPFTSGRSLNQVQLRIVEGQALINLLQYPDAAD